jgi:hypothetical protein
MDKKSDALSNKKINLQARILFYIQITLMVVTSGLFLLAFYGITSNGEDAKKSLRPTANIMWMEIGMCLPGLFSASWLVHSLWTLRQQKMSSYSLKKTHVLILTVCFTLLNLQTIIALVVCNIGKFNENKFNTFIGMTFCYVVVAWLGFSALQYVMFSLIRIQLKFEEDQ